MIREEGGGESGGGESSPNPRGETTGEGLGLAVSLVRCQVDGADRTNEWGGLWRGFAACHNGLTAVCGGRCAAQRLSDDASGRESETDRMQGKKGPTFRSHSMTPKVMVLCH